MLRGALLLLTNPANFEAFGDLTPQEMADVWSDVFVTLADDQNGGAAMPVGAVFFLAYESTPPANLLPCDGRSVLKSTYAALYTAIGDLFTASPGGDSFNVPNIVDRFVLGANEDLGGVGGEAAVTLQGNQLPPHSHGIPVALNVGGSVARVEAKSLTTVVDNVLTSSYGGGAAHNNMPPFITLRPVIVAE